MLKLLQFNGQTVTPKDDSLWNELITEKCGAFIGVDVTSLGSNVIKVTDGRILVKGRQIIITEEDVNVQLSTDGTKKGRLLIHVDLSSETPATFQSQVADELPELVQDADFNESNGIYEIELAQYDVDVLAVSNFEETIEKIDGVMEILSTEEELMANTQAGRVADALVVKDINSSLANCNFSTVENDDGETEFYIQLGDDETTKTKLGGQTMKLIGTFSTILTANSNSYVLDLSTYQGYESLTTNDLLPVLKRIVTYNANMTIEPIYYYNSNTGELTVQSGNSSTSSLAFGVGSQIVDIYKI